MSLPNPSSALEPRVRVVGTPLMPDSGSTAPGAGGGAAGTGTGLGAGGVVLCRIWRFSPSWSATTASGRPSRSKSAPSACTTVAYDGLW